MWTTNYAPGIPIWHKSMVNVGKYTKTSQIYTKHFSSFPYHGAFNHEVLFGLRIL